MIYVYDKKTDRMVPKGSEYAGRHHNVMSDINPYKSMIDGSMITSRSSHRDHLRAHGCIEIGNESPEIKSAAAPKSERRKRVLADQLWNMSDRQADKLLNQLRERR